MQVQSTVPATPSSWVDRLIGWVDTRPVPRWAAYAMASGVLASGVLILHWLTGAVPAGLLPIPVIFTAARSPLNFAMIHDARRVAQRALDTFRPAIGADAEAYTTWQRRFSTFPSILPLVAFIAAAVFIAGVLVYDPSLFGLLSGRTLSDVAITLAAWSNTGLLLLAMLGVARYLAYVGELHRAAACVNPLQREPVFAFSRLTFRMSLYSALAVYLFLAVFPVMQTNPLTLGFVIVAVAVAAAVAVLPLMGLHERLADAKDRLAAEVHQRIAAAFRELHRRTDAADLVAMDGLNKQLSSLVLEEDYIRRIPTWPWTPGALTGLLTTILLPLIIYLLQRLFERVIGP